MLVTISPEQITKAVLEAPKLGAFPIFDQNGIHPKNLRRNAVYALTLYSLRENNIPYFDNLEKISFDG